MFIRIAAIVAAIFAATVAPAALIQVTATGTLTSIATGPSSSLPIGAPSIGDATRFDLVYDTSFPDTLPLFPQFGSYADAFVSATARFGTVEIILSRAGDLNVRNNESSSDSFEYSSGFFASPFGSGTVLQLQLRDSSQAVFSNDALPTGPLDINAFDRRTFVLSTGTANFFSSVDTLTVTDLTAVPLPAGGALLLGGLGAAALVRRRRAA